MHLHMQVLDLCSDDELESVYELLYAPSPFSPMVKSLVAESEPALLGLRGRVSCERVCALLPALLAVGQ